MLSHKIGLSTKVVTDRSMREVAEFAARIGYTGLEIFGVEKHIPVQTTLPQAREFGRQFDALGLKTVTLCSYVGGFAEGSDVEAAKEIDGFRHYLDIAGILGCDMVRVWADRLGRTLRHPRDDHYLRAAHYLAIAADLAAEVGVKILLENHLTLTISAASTIRLIRLIDRPNVVVNFDPGNMYLGGEAYGRSTVERLLPHIGNVQVKEGSMPADAPGGGGDAHDATLSRGGSYDLLLGEGTMDHMSYLRPLVASRYAGYYMAECHKTATAEWPSERIAAFEFTALKGLLESAARPAAVATA
jgi:sugar phosphate isomerase/epimerase